MCHAHQGKKRVEVKAFNYSRPASWKGFQDSELDMRQSFLGTPLLPPPPLPALRRRVDYMSMKKKKNQYFYLLAVLSFYLFCFCWLESLNNCWSVTKLMTLFCLLQNNSTSKSTDQKGPSLCVGVLSCPPWLCAVGFLIEPFLMLGLLQCRKNCCCQVLHAVLCCVGLKAENCQENFKDTGTNSSLM